MRLFAAALVAASVIAAPAFAQDILQPNSKLSTYGSIGYTYADGGTGEQFGVITGRLGVKKGYFGVEAEAGGGVVGSHIGSINTRLDYEVAGYGIVTVPVTNNVQLLARLGYGHSQASAAFGNVSVRVEDNSVNYGAGGIFSLNEHDHIRAEYTRYDFGTGGTVNGWSIAYVRKF
jgi:hypothetical protein